MLILTRRPMESIHIGHDVTVTVLSIRGNQVRIGIQAPLSVVIDRAEIAARKLKERDAASVPPDTSRTA